jgi:hypothetical protein
MKATSGKIEVEGADAALAQLCPGSEHVGNLGLASADDLEA